MIEGLPNDFTGCYRNEEGTLVHVKDGKYHNDDGPAMVFLDGTKKWGINNFYHRLDGPAIISYDEEQQKFIYYYYINGLPYSEEKFYKLPIVIEKITNRILEQ